MNRIAGIIPFVLALLLCRAIASEWQTCSDSFGKEGLCVPLSSCTEVSESFKSNQVFSLTEINNFRALQSACTHTSETIETMVGIHSMICCFTKLKRDKVEHYVPKSCGQKPTTDNSPFGWTVLLGTGHFYRRCVGTLINSVFVLTAAHCVNEVEPHEITLYFGQVPVRELPQCLEHDHCLKASGLQLWKHPGFNSSTNIFNVAVIETNLNKDSILRYPNIGIYPICLPLNATDEDTQLEKRHILRPRIYDTTNGIQEACGYSGAPIVVLDNEKRYHVVGVANHPVDCDRKRVKRDATPLMEYVDWILSVLPEGREEPETIKD